MNAFRMPWMMPAQLKELPLVSTGCPSGDFRLPWLGQYGPGQKHDQERTNYLFHDGGTSICFCTACAAATNPVTTAPTIIVIVMGAPPPVALR
jgi:hypothetical protein